MLVWNKTKIITTIGPASIKKSVLKKMMLSGADVMRINGAHETLEKHAETIKIIRKTAQELNLPIAILFDLPGPKIRLGELKTEPIFLKRNSKVTIACGKSKQTDEKIPLPNKIISKSIKKGEQFYINDGIVCLKVLNISGNNLECLVLAGGEIRSRKGLNFPQTHLNIPTITKNDIVLLNFAIKQKIDFIGVSFVRSSSDIKKVRNILKKKNYNAKIIAKIEKPEALDDLDNIIKTSDAVMVARGDLGIEMPFNKIPLIQKWIHGRAMYFGKPSITATQMMESMVNSSRPTRAETTDVAGAVWQGTDAVMLSEETSIGNNPALVVKAMSMVVAEAERDLPEFIIPERKTNPDDLIIQTICAGANVLADELNSSAIVTPTRMGRTPLFISRLRPSCQIIAPTEDEKVARHMNLLWGVRPMAMPTFSTVDEMLQYAENVALRSKFIKKNDTIIITSGAHANKNDLTRLIEVRRI